MSHITANESMLQQLRGILEPVEIRDAHGNVLGRYTPNVVEEELYRTAAALFDPAETDRIAREERGGRPLAEFLKELESRENPR